MDVKQARLLKLLVIGGPLLLAACGENATETVEQFQKTSAECAATAVPNRFIVHWNNGHTSVEKAVDRETFIREVLRPRQSEIDFAEHDQIVRRSDAVLTPLSETDPDLINWGQETIEAPQVWSAGIDGDGVIVAVIDSGVDIEHNQLKTQIAANPAEVLNGEDDDGNGYVDDVNGYDFHNVSGEVSDVSGHGTHVAGIVAADHSAGTVHGVAPGAKILPLGFMDEDGAGALSDAILAMQYAVSRGAKIVNASWGGAPCSKSLESAIRELENHGVLFVAAAGNSGLNLDYDPEFPAAYDLEGQITVGASTLRDYTASFSNYSDTLVHLLAPGSNIYSTYPGNQAVSMNGTSMATPFVSGVAALLWSHRPQATVAQIKASILNSVTPGSFAVLSGGRLNAAKAIAEIERLTSQ